MMTRCVEPEILDHLPEDDPGAIRSRGDLRRINRIMGSAAVVDSLLAGSLARAPLRIAELGAGDGTLLLKLAKQRAQAWPGVSVTFVDRQRLLDAPTRAAYVRLGWAARIAVMDIFDWLGRDDHPVYDAIVANLFLHHFEADALSRMFRAIARITGCFVACEPRRGQVALLGSRLVGAVGANEVTRRDAVLSVRAGFRGQELSRVWPDDGGWQLNETGARLFSHTFVATRRVSA